MPSLNGIQLALSGEVPLQFGDVRVVPAVAELFVEDLEEHAEDGVAPAALSALLSMLNRMTSTSLLTARLMSPASMASWILPSKNSMARLVCPAWVTARFSSR